MVHPKKNLGQHFLTDKNIAAKIVNALPNDTRNLLEIGPGKGILTDFLIRRNIPNLAVIELDRESVDYLEAHFPDLNGKIIGGDFLRFDVAGIFPGTFSLIGNFPYNISSQILFRVLEFRNRIDVVVGMFQKEVAERIASKPGSKKYGILSVLLQAYFDIEYLFTVPEQVFFPKPKVKSGVIRLYRNQVSKLDCDETLFLDVVKTAFNQRRKTLRNALGKFTEGKHTLPREVMSQRAEQLSVQDFENLTRAIQQIQ